MKYSGQNVQTQSNYCCLKRAVVSPGLCTQWAAQGEEVGRCDTHTSLLLPCGLMVLTAEGQEPEGVAYAHPSAGMQHCMESGSNRKTHDQPEIWGAGPVPCM